MTIYDTDSEGNLIVLFDSRWRYPETLGYQPTDPEYVELQKLWEQATGETIYRNGGRMCPSSTKEETDT